MQTEIERILSKDRINASGDFWEHMALKNAEEILIPFGVQFDTQGTFKERELSQYPIGAKSQRYDIRMYGLPDDTKDGRILLVNHLSDPTSSILKKLSHILNEEIPAYPEHIPVMLLLAGKWRDVPLAIPRANAAVDRLHFLHCFDGFDEYLAWAKNMGRHLLGLEPNPDNRVSEPSIIEYTHKGINGTCVQTSLWEPV